MEGKNCNVSNVGELYCSEGFVDKCSVFGGQRGVCSKWEYLCDTGSIQDCIVGCLEAEVVSWFDGSYDSCSGKANQVL